MLRGNNCFLGGYYGMRNTGDDALLAVASWGIRRFLAPDRIFVTSAEVPDIPSREMLVPTYAVSPRFRGENGLRAYCRSARCASVVFGGGSVFHSAGYIKAARRFLALSGKGPKLALGVSIGPFRDTASERECGKLLRLFDFVGVRDAESKAIASGISPDVVCEKTFDLAALMRRIIPSSEASPAEEKRRGLGFALCDYDRFVGGNPERDRERKRKWKDLVGGLDADEVEELVFLEFNGHPAFGDGDLIREVASAAPRIPVRCVSYSSDPFHFLRVIGNLKGLVAMRLHAGIYAYLAKTPFLFVSYHAKCRAWAGEVGMPSESLFDGESFEVDRIRLSISDLLSGKHGNCGLQIAIAEEKAMRNWSWK